MRTWIAILAVDVLLLSWVFPSWLGAVPRFTFPALNYAVFMSLVAMVPISAIGIAATFQSRWVRWPIGGLGSLLILPALVIILITALSLVSTLATGQDASFEQIAELGASKGTFRAYRTNGGATTDFGVVLRRERSIIPGLLSIVSVQCSYYHAREATLARLSESRGRMVIAAYGDDNPERSCEFDL